jgi:hypothetical protein
MGSCCPFLGVCIHKCVLFDPVCLGAAVLHSAAAAVSVHAGGGHWAFTVLCILVLCMLVLWPVTVQEQQYPCTFWVRSYAACGGICTGMRVRNHMPYGWQFRDNVAVSLHRMLGVVALICWPRYAGCTAVSC